MKAYRILLFQNGNCNESVVFSDSVTNLTPLISWNTFYDWLKEILSQLIQ